MIGRVLQPVDLGKGMFILGNIYERGNLHRLCCMQLREAIGVFRV